MSNPQKFYMVRLSEEEMELLHRVLKVLQQLHDTAVIDGLVDYTWALLEGISVTRGEGV